MIGTGTVTIDGSTAKALARAIFEAEDGDDLANFELGGEVHPAIARELSLLIEARNRRDGDSS